MSHVVQIIGTTGVGKSQLSISLAKVFGGEIINSDSMQVYKGMDIITNKHPEDKREGIRHHLLGFLETDDEYRIGNYETDATQVITRLHHENKLPIIVGGTAYYATSLLFKNLLLATSAVDSPDSSPSREIVPDPRLELPTEDLFEKLKQVDPIMATRWHPRDRRKIRRSLEIYYTTGQRQSEIYSRQREDGRINPSQVRYPTLILWLWSAQAVLDQRLDARIDEMIKSGLFDEIKDLYDKHPSPDAIDFTRGIYQAIGFKEFYPYLKSRKAIDKQKGTEMMKAATRRYAKKQIKWIRNKLLLQCEQAGNAIQVVVLDATNLENWDTQVMDPAKAAVSAFCYASSPDDNKSDGPLATNLATRFEASKHTDPSLQRLLVPATSREFSSAPDSWSFHDCPECPGFSTNSDSGWKEHLESRRHHNKVKQKAKKIAHERWREAQAKTIEP